MGNAGRGKAAAHALKGMAGSLSAPLLAKRASELEEIGRRRDLKQACLSGLEVETSRFAEELDRCQSLLSVGS